AWERSQRVLSNNPDDRSCRQLPSVPHGRQSECGRSSHHTLIKSVIGIVDFSAFISTSVTCDGNEEGRASFAVPDSNTTQLPAVHFGNAAVSETQLPLASHLR